MGASLVARLVARRLYYLKSPEAGERKREKERERKIALRDFALVVYCILLLGNFVPQRDSPVLIKLK